MVLYACIYTYFKLLNRIVNNWAHGVKIHNAPARVSVPKFK
jgi:hypothetical protein